MRTPKRYVAADGTVTWRVRFRLDKAETTETFDTKREAEDFCALLEVLGAQGAVDHRYAEDQAASVPTFDTYVAQFIEDLTRPNLSTKDRYRSIVRLHWSPLIGTTPMHQVTRSDIARVVNTWAADGSSDKSIRNWWGAVAPAFHRCALDGVVSKDPTVGVKLPRNTEHETEEMVILAAADATRLLESMHDHYRPLVITLLETGMRWGEAAALDVGDVDSTERTIRITKAMKQSGDIGPPKTRRSRRTIYYNDTVADALAGVLKGRGKREALFTAPRGGRIRHRTFWSDIWRPAIWSAQHCADHYDPDCRCGTAHPERCKVHVDEVPEPCGCEGTLTVTPRIHDLRHTHASTLLAAGVPINVVSDRLGHTSIQTTVDVYDHLRPDVQKMAAQVGALGLMAGAPDAPAIGS